MKFSVALRGLATFVLATALVLMTACGVGSSVEDPNLTLSEAKAIAQDGELDIVALIPKNVILKVNQQHLGPLMSCSGENNRQWAGGTRVEVEEDADLGAILDRVAEAYRDREGWETERMTDPDGSPELDISRPHTGGYFVSGWSDPTVINIFSFSPCFHLPDDVSPHGLY